MPKNCISRPRWFPPKNITERASDLSAKKSEVITSSGSEAELSSKLLFSAFSSLHSLLWFLNQLNWDKCELLPSSIQGREATRVTEQVLKSVDHIETPSHLFDILTAVDWPMVCICALFISSVCASSSHTVKVTPAEKTTAQSNTVWALLCPTYSNDGPSFPPAVAMVIQMYFYEKMIWWVSPLWLLDVKHYLCCFISLFLLVQKQDHC